jgi:DNA-cytosine methyltransferase
MELFAGAGGMGLGFLLAGSPKCGYRVLFSGEFNSIFANTLRGNHEFLRKKGRVAPEDVPAETIPMDLRTPSVMDRVQSIARDAGGIDILIGGPPCQGFSNANRNSWSSTNPNNRLVDTYLDYVARLRPGVFIMENVQGILWTPRHDLLGRLSVAEHVATRVAALGYRIFPKLIDAAWYGVPQHRNRFFLLGIHGDLGYAQDDFGEWGPFPRPTHGPTTSERYVTVRDAIEDLPTIENGAEVDELAYHPKAARGNRFLALMRRWSPAGIIWDHVTSRHAQYVIDRYSHIPAGGNWSDIAQMMTNYAAVERTHSNIYRRLVWDEPSITIGHYRKAMLVHPAQHRGLSLREASRLQSFPDWFRFAGGEDQKRGGLVHKQQQLGNAVCPLVTKAVADFLLKL